MICVRLKKKVFCLTLLLLLAISSWVPADQVHGQQPASYTTYEFLSDDVITWTYGSTLVAYERTPSGLIKVRGPASFQNISFTYLQQNTPQQSDLTPASQSQWATIWQNHVSNPNNFYFFDKYAFTAISAELRKSGNVSDSWFFYDIRIDLETLQITVNRLCNHCNTTGYNDQLAEIVQMNNHVLVLFWLWDTEGLDDKSLRVGYARADNSHYLNANIPLGSGTGVDSVEYDIRLRNSDYIVVRLRENACTNYYRYNEYTYLVYLPSNSTTVVKTSLYYSPRTGCTAGSSSGIPDPTLMSITFHGMAGRSVFVTQDNAYYKCELQTANNTIGTFANCIAIDQSEIQNTGIYISVPAYRYSQLSEQNSILPHTLFMIDSNQFSKAKWFMIYTQALSLTDREVFYAIDLQILLTTNVNLSARNLYAERPQSVSNDASKLAAGVWKLRVVTVNNNQTTTIEYAIAGIHLTNRLEVNTLQAFFDAGNSANITIYLVWQITYNNELKERVYNLEFMREGNISAASIDFSNPNVSFNDVTVIFTNPALNNIDMYVKLTGFDVFVDLKRTAPDKIKFFAIEGNCYQIYKRNQTYTWLGNVCAVPPFTFTIGPSEGQEGGILLGIYWWPQWYVTHLYYQNNNTLDVILHKTPPFHYRIVIRDANNNNVFTDTGWQVGNVDPLTRNFSLGPSERYKLIVYGRDNNVERIVYTADVMKTRSVQFFLPFNYAGINVMLLVVVASMLMWSKNNASVGVVATVAVISLLNYLGLISINDSMMLLLFVLAGISLIITKRIFG